VSGNFFFFEVSLFIWIWSKEFWRLGRIVSSSVANRFGLSGFGFSSLFEIFLSLSNSDRLWASILGFLAR
jgi:hypothetical protein